MIFINIVMMQDVPDEKLDQMEQWKEAILISGGKLPSGQIGRNRVLTTWAVGEESRMEIGRAHV